MRPSCSNASKKCLQVKVKVKVYVVCAKLTLVRQLLFSLHCHFLFHEPQSQRNHTAKDHLPHRFEDSMDSQPAAGDVDVFRAGIARVLSTLTDAIDDETATTIIRFALLSVDMDVERLKILVIMIYNSTTLSSKCVVRLLMKLLQLTPPSLRANITNRSGKSVLLTTFRVTRSFLLQECQPDFEGTITKAVWSPKPIMVAAALF